MKDHLKNDVRRLERENTLLIRDKRILEKRLKVLEKENRKLRAALKRGEED